MTLNREQFAAGMAVLGGAFGREVDGPIIVAYYRTLDGKLTDAEFERAVSLTLESEKFWPSPAVLLSKVKADDMSQAALALEHVRRVLWENGGVRFVPFAAYEAFDANTKAAIKAAGGLAAIADDDSKALAKKFADGFIRARNGVKLLPPEPPVDHRVRRLTNDTARTLSLVSGRDRAAGADRD